MVVESIVRIELHLRTQAKNFETHRSWLLALITRKVKRTKKSLGAMVDEEEDPARMMIDDDDDDDDDNDDDNENENDKVLCRVKLDCSEMAFEKLLYYLYTALSPAF